MLNLKSAIVLSFLMLFHSISLSQSKPEKVIWGAKLKKTKELGKFIYKEQNLYSLNYQLKAVQKFSPDKLSLTNTLSLDGRQGSLKGHTFDLFEAIESLIEYKDGLGLFVEYLSKDDNKKYFGFFPLGLDLNNLKPEGQVLFEMDLGKKEDYQFSEIVTANENYQAIFSYNSTSDKEEAIAQLDVVAMDGSVYTEKFSFKGEEDKSGQKLTFSEEEYLVQTWTEETSEVKLYDGLTSAVISTFSLREFLEHDGRVLSIQKQDNGEYILAGFYGKFTKEKNEILGLFRIVLTANGSINSKTSDTFLMSEISTTQELSSVDEVLITDAGDLFFILTSSTGSKKTIISGAGTTVYEQLMVVGIHLDEIWTKSIPFRQGYGSMVWSDHLGPHAIEKDGHLILSYNDNRKNGKNFDYNHFEYSSKNRPDKYTCSLPDVITMLDIDNEGDVKPYFINVYEIFTNLTGTIPLDDGTIFISGGTATIAGAGKSRFARIILN